MNCLSDHLASASAASGDAAGVKMMVFDVFGTAVDWRSSVIAEGEQLGRRKGLTRLRKRYVIAPLSNGNLSLLTNMAKFSGLPWDCILSAELVRHYKPDPEVYLSAVEFFDLRPSEVMMVAAHQADLAVPKKLGMRTAYVHRPYEGGAGRGPHVPPPASFDLIVKDFGELASRVGL